MRHLVLALSILTTGLYSSATKATDRPDELLCVHERDANGAKLQSVICKKKDDWVRLLRVAVRRDKQSSNAVQPGMSSASFYYGNDLHLRY